MASLLYEKCLEIYENSGQSGVFDFIAANSPDTAWAYCEPCEIESPIEDGDCLVCGSLVEVKVIG